MNFWTSERIKILQEQWAAGTSARAIAAQLGSGRNAVIGKANRLGLATHVAARLRKAQAKRGPKKGSCDTTRKQARAPGGRPLPQAPLAEARPIRFADLLQYHCRYAVTDDAPFLFCGDVRQRKSPYCAFHHALSHVAPRPNEKRPAAPRRLYSRFDFTLVRVRAA
jgi:hypothetical protein